MEKKHKVFATILVVLVSLSMIGSYFAIYFGGSGLPSADSNTTNAANAAANYQAQKARIAAIAERAKADPTNVALQKDLGNEYYDAGVAAQTVAPADVQANYKHAVEAYQNVLKVNKDINVMVDMATAAFNSGDNDLAERTFKEALSIQPDFYIGLRNYGYFLAYVKKDLPGAITQWQKAQNAAPDNTQKEQMASWISQAQNQLKAPANSGASSLNPALRGGASQPATPGK